MSSIVTRFARSRQSDHPARSANEPVFQSGEFGLVAFFEQAHHDQDAEIATPGTLVHARTGINVDFPVLGPAAKLAAARLPAAGRTLGNAGCRPRGAVQPGGRDRRRARGGGLPGLPSGHVQPGSRGPAPFSHASHARGRAARGHLSLALVAGPSGANRGRADLGRPGLHLGAGGRGAWDRRHDPGVPSRGRHDPGAGPPDQVGGLDHHDRNGRIGRPGGTDRPDRLGLRLLPGPGAEAAAQRAANPDAGRRGGGCGRHLPGTAGRGPVRRGGALLHHRVRVGRAAPLPGQLDRGLFDVRPVHHPQADLPPARPDLSGAAQTCPCTWD